MTFIESAIASMLLVVGGYIIYQAATDTPKKAKRRALERSAAVQLAERKWEAECMTGKLRCYSQLECMRCQNFILAKTKEAQRDE